MKKFNVVPQDLIKGGYFEYELVPKSQMIRYKGEITARKFLFSKTIPVEGSQLIDFKHLRSTQYKVGSEVKFANLRGKVLSVEKGIAKAYVDLREAAVSAKGYAHFSLAGEFVELLGLDTSGTVVAPVVGEIPFRLVLAPASVHAQAAKKDTVWPIEGEDGSEK